MVLFHIEKLEKEKNIQFFSLFIPDFIPKTTPISRQNRPAAIVNNLLIYQTYIGLIPYLRPSPDSPVFHPRLLLQNIQFFLNPSSPPHSSASSPLTAIGIAIGNRPLADCLHTESTERVDNRLKLESHQTYIRPLAYQNTANHPPFEVRIQKFRTAHMCPKYVEKHQNMGQCTTFEAFQRIILMHFLPLEGLNIVGVVLQKYCSSLFTRMLIVAFCCLQSQSQNHSCFLGYPYFLFFTHFIYLYIL